MIPAFLISKINRKYVDGLETLEKNLKVLGNLKITKHNQRKYQW